MRRLLSAANLVVATSTLLVLACVGSACSSSDDGSEFKPDEGTTTDTPASSGGFGTSDGGSGGGSNDGSSTSGEAGASAVCGDGQLGGTELCDDGNTLSGDGCDGVCVVEADYVCNVPGQPCAKIGTCGDAFLKSGEQCDDGNGIPGDGCSATCQIESGWICPVLGASCLAAQCGDGLLAGDEECDDGDANDTNGCSNACRIKDGMKCPVPGTPCVPTTCGDNAKEGTEQCDDANTMPYDGCSPTCTKEPTCPKQGGVCVGACGDGIIFPGEECDDGNTKAGDGCSPTCTKEPGFDCTAVVADLPMTLTVPVILRDFSRGDKISIPGSNCTTAAGCPNGHPDFETASGSKTGMVGKLFNDVDTANIGKLDADGKPVLACTSGLGTCKATSKASFAQWYRDLPGDPQDPTTRVNHTYVQDLPLTLFGAGTADPRYEFSNGSWFPLTGLGFGNQWNGSEGGGNKNFHFTSELRFWFTYDANAPAPKFDFTGDDDVWVFINGQLAVDIGGVHGALSASVTLDATNAGKLGLVSGNVYEFALFQAERHRSESNYKATFRGFVRAKSTCTPKCGDGIKTKTEACDDGANNDTNVPPAAPAYGKCGSDCKARGPFCGDGITNGTEACDDGPFNGGYGKCKADCSGPGPSCGDGVVQANFGEVCDDGANNASTSPPPYGQCAPDCRTKPRCGDGIIQSPETCEPPNTSSCSATCVATGPK